MQIIEYFEDGQMEHWIKEIEGFPWRAAGYLAELLKENRFAGQLISHACAEAVKAGCQKVYLATDHIGLYEKYGFLYQENRPDMGGEDSRIYYKLL